MTYIAWDDRYAIGIAAIDEQHRALFQLINQVHDAPTREVSVQVLASLVGYIKDHFALEERMMASAGYAGLAEHRAEHHRFTLAVLSAHDDYLDGRAVLTERLLPLMRDWLRDHVLTVDRAYIPALQSLAR
jgi:hemerythrin-like metal-binding protein